MKEKTKLIILVIGFLIIATLLVSAIQDILNITIKDKINPTAFHIILYTLIFILIVTMFNLSPFKELKKKWNDFLTKKKIK